MNWLTNPFAIAWKAKLDKKAEGTEHDKDNKDCPQNRCGEWAGCNNYECEGEHECICV